MRNSIKQNWLFFKQNPDILFFYAFLISSTLSIRKVLFYYPIQNTFNEYTGVYIYLSDILLISTFLLYILYNKIYIVSILRTLAIDFYQVINLFHVEQIQKNTKLMQNCSTWNKLISTLSIVPRGTIKQITKTYALFVNHYLILFPLFALLFSFLSIMWTTNWQLGLFKSLKLSEFILLYFYIFSFVPRGTNCKTNTQHPSENNLFHVEQMQKRIQLENNTLKYVHCSTWNKLQNNIVPRGTMFKKSIQIIISIAIVQSIIAIVQILIQQSIGLFWLKESIISQTTQGVAKLILNDNAYIRAYGLFPHPNILGGYLIFSIILTLLYFKLFHVEQKIKSKNTSDEILLICSTWNKLQNNISRIVPRGTKLLKVLTLIQLVALALTFSKSAIIGLSIGLLYIAYQKRISIVPRGTRNNNRNNIKVFLKLFHVEQMQKKLILITCILLISLLAIKPNINSFFTQSLQERTTYLHIAYEFIENNPILGLGTGQFVINMPSIKPDLSTWQHQPVHNVFLLIASEFGIPMSIAILFFLVLLLKNNNCSTWNNYKERTTIIHLKGLLLSLVFIMLFDHYLWDIQQGCFILWLFLGFIGAVITKLSKKHIDKIN